MASPRGATVRVTCWSRDRRSSALKGMRGLERTEGTIAMVLKIERDQRRFKQIVRGKIRENLRKYITHGEMIGRKGRDLISIPVPKLDIPHFRYGHNGSGGVGQGDGEVGQPIGKGGDPKAVQAKPAATRVEATSSRSTCRSKNWPKSSATNSSCPASNPKAKPISARKKTAIARSGKPDPKPCGISVAPT